MLIGLPKEVKDGESRVALTPEGAGTLVADGHTIAVQAGAGIDAGFADEEFRCAGGEIVAHPEEVYACEMIVKVKELQPREYGLLQPGRIVFGFQQLARDALLLQTVLDARLSCLACELVADRDGELPLLAPMSQIAGRLAPLIGAHWLQRQNGGSGVLLPGAPGIESGRVVILGAGNVGREAARVAGDLGCGVTQFARQGRTVNGVDIRRSDPFALAAAVAEADLVIGAVFEPGALSPKLITREMLRAMRPGSVFIDVGIDMGGISETSRQTSFSHPTYVEEGVVHYCVANIPASVPHTATLAFTQATLPYVRSLAQQGLAGALKADAGLRRALLTHDGQVVHARLARDTAREWVEFKLRGA